MFILYPLTLFVDFFLRIVLSTLNRCLQNKFDEDKVLAGKPAANQKNFSVTQFKPLLSL